MQVTANQKELFNIGEVVSMLRSEFTEISISKIRYFEKEDLISPQRTAGGYRKFDQNDVNKLAFILKLQKEQYLPLAVIRLKLEEYNESHVGRKGHQESSDDNNNTSELTVDEVLGRLRISSKELYELSDYGLIKIEKKNGNPVVRSDSLEVIRIMIALKEYGIESRHIKFYKNFAIKQASLLEQISNPLKNKYADERKKEELMEKLIGMSLGLNGSLLRQTMFNDK